MLLGSSVLSAMIWIGDKEVQLGTVVNRALDDSGLTADEWNALTELAREYKLVDAVYAMREEARLNNLPTSMFCSCCGSVPFPHNCPGVMF